MASSQRAAATRERLIAAALELLEQDGHDAITTVAVTRAAGIVQSGFYRHFDDIETLRVEALSRAAAAFATDVDRLRTAWLGDPGHGPKIRDSYARELVSQLMATRATYRQLASLRYAAGPLGDVARAAMTRLADDLAAYLGGLVASDAALPAPDPDVLAFHARLLVDDVLTVARVADECVLPDSRRRLESLVADRLRHGWEALVTDLEGS